MSNKYLILIFLSLLVIGCENNDQKSKDNREFLVPALLQSPYLDKTIVSAGDDFNIYGNFDSDLYDISIVGDETNQGASSYFDKDKYAVNATVSCAASEGDYYPTIRLSTPDITATYTPDLSSNPVSYIVDYFIGLEDVKYQLETGSKVEFPDESIKLLAPKLIIETSYTDEKSNLTINIENVSVNESSITTDYKLTNTGNRSASSFTLKFWGNLENPPVDNQEFVNYRNFNVPLCIDPDEEIYASVVLDKTTEAGTAYVSIHNWWHPDGESNLTDTVSNDFSW